MSKIVKPKDIGLKILISAHARVKMSQPAGASGKKAMLL